MDEAINSIIHHVIHPRITAKLQALGKKIYQTKYTLKAEYFCTPEPVDFKDKDNYDFKAIQTGEVWTKTLFDCAWFRFFLPINAGIGFNNPDDYVIIINTGAEGCVYSKDGVPLLGLTSVMGYADLWQPIMAKKIIPLKTVLDETNDRIDFYVDVGNNGYSGKQRWLPRLKRADICLVNKNLLALYYDLMTVFQFASSNKDKRKEYNEVLKRALNIVGNGDKELKIAEARKELSVFFNNINNFPFEITAVGHAHLDLAWLWPIRETKRKAERTITNALNNIDLYDGYIFGISQPQMLEWIKEKHPKLFERIKKAIADGRIEPQGCMWVEPDTNLPCGESLIRQCYYGKKFWMDEFGVDMRYLWVPDVFGYTASLPRILNGSDVDKFMTIKLSWNTYNKFPHHSFNWSGIGDSNVLVHMPPEGDYNSTGLPGAVKKIYNEYREKDVSRFALMPFGIGDGGGGPGQANLEVLTREQGMKDMPKVVFGKAGDFFRKLEGEKDKLPSYKGELYLEKHQGTYTTQGHQKRNNRKTEIMLHNVEFLSTLAYLRGYAYPEKELDKIWKEVLLYQFHDILPGSSIARVYKECAEAFARLQSNLSELTEKAEKYFEGNTLCAVNGSPVMQKGYTNINNRWFTYNTLPYSSGKLIEVVREKEDDLKYGDDFIENNLIKVVFAKNGDIKTIIEKISGTALSDKNLGGLRVYCDPKNIPFDAWDININYTKIKPSVPRVVSVDTTIDGMRIVRKVVSKYHKSTFTQNYILYVDEDMLRVENKVDWQESHKMLRADYRPKYFGKKVLCDIQMGNLERNTTTDTRVDWAQMEIPAHKWVDVYDNGFGMAILNDCKYGHRVKDGLMSLNLLRSPDYPDRKADRGEHEFTYALYPHQKPAFESDLIMLGYKLNNPVSFANVEEMPPIAYSSNKNVIIETVMVTPEGRVALRLYETTGNSAETDIIVSFGYKEVSETNLLFKNPYPISSIKGLTFGGFEIKTLEFVL